MNDWENSRTDNFRAKISKTRVFRSRSPLLLLFLLVLAPTESVNEEEEKNANRFSIALMGIAKDVASLNIVPSYKLSIAQVYQDTATRILQNTNSLRLLSAAGLEHNNTDKNPGLPSWVPDWSSTSNLNLLGQRADISSLESIQTHGLPWLSTPSFPDPSILYVKGYILDAPKSLMTPFPTAPLTLASSDAFHLNHGNGVSMLSTPTIHTTGEEFNYAYYMGPWGGRAGVSTLL